MIKRYVQKGLKIFKEQLEEAARSKTTTHEIALGLAVGTFIAFLPLLGFQVGRVRDRREGLDHAAVHGGEQLLNFLARDVPHWPRLLG